MTRILYWNIENFGVNKVDNPSFAVTPGHGGLQDDEASVVRRDLILEHITQLTPDIIVVVEVSTGAAAGDLIPNTGGLQGCEFLLTHLRGNAPYNAQNWRLVPPLIVGQGGVRESVAVFFRGNTGAVNRFFTGPNWYTGGYAGQSVDPGAAAAVAYPNVVGQPNILSMLAPGGVARNTPPNARPVANANMPETQLAARIRFASNAAPPAPVNFGFFRQPYMTTFTEIGGAVNPRHLTIFACHAPPANFFANQFMALLPTMADITNGPAGGETQVICGDFNLNLLTPAGADANPYAGLTAAPHNYFRKLVPAGAPPAPLGGYKGYFATHIRPKPNRATANDLFLWSSNAALSPYPGYGYFGSNFAVNFYSIDNVLVRPAAVGQTMTVANSVVGTPMNAVLPTPGGAPPGIDPFPHDMQNLLPAGLVWPEAPNAAPFTIGMAGNRKGWWNYGHIRNTSDHFALMAQV